MAFSDLTPEQQADFARADKIVRGTLSSLRQLINTVDWEMFDQLMTDSVQPALDTLGSTDVLPNSTDLGGARDVTKAQWLAMQAFITKQIRKPMATNRGKLLKLIGINY